MFFLRLYYTVEINLINWFVIPEIIDYPVFIKSAEFRLKFSKDIFH